MAFIISSEPACAGSTKGETSIIAAKVYRLDISAGGCLMQAERQIRSSLSRREDRARRC